MKHLVLRRVMRDEPDYVQDSMQDFADTLQTLSETRSGTKNKKRCGECSLSWRIWEFSQDSTVLTDCLASSCVNS